MKLFLSQEEVNFFSKLEYRMIVFIVTRRISLKSINTKSSLLLLPRSTLPEKFAWMKVAEISPNIHL